MVKLNLIKDVWKAIEVEEDMCQEMDYLDRHFDELTISELYYAFSILDGEALAIENYCRELTKEDPGFNTISDIAAKWYKKRKELNNRLLDVRVCLA